MGDEPTLYEHDVDVNGWVIELQTAPAAGHDPGPLDGKFRWRTARAVIAFQRSFGLKSDGIAGNQTWAALRGRAPEPPGVNNKPYGSTLAEPEPAVAAAEPAPEPVMAAASGAAGGAVATQPAAAQPASDSGLVVPDGEPTEPGGYPMGLRINVPDAEVESVTVDAPMFLVTLRLSFGGGNLTVAPPDTAVSFDQSGFRLEIQEQVGEYFSGIRLNGIGGGVTDGPLSLGVIAGNEFVTTEVRMISPLQYAYLGRATIDIDMPTSYGQSRISGGFGYRVDLTLTPKAPPPVPVEEEQAWYESAWEWVDEHATEILVGAVVVGVIIVAPEAAPGILRLAW